MRKSFRGRLLPVRGILSVPALALGVIGETELFDGCRAVDVRSLRKIKQMDLYQRAAGLNIFSILKYHIHEILFFLIISADHS